MNLQSIKNNSVQELIIKKSRFISYSYFCQTPDDVVNYIDKLKGEHKKANHVCWAYVIAGAEKSSDDGEPQGTAGVPILEIIKKHNLSNVLICVVRYFGGIMLGAGGLIRAYSKGASGVSLLSERTIIKTVYNYKCTIEYGSEFVLNKIKELYQNIRVEYNDKIHAEFQHNQPIDSVDYEFVKMIDIRE